MNNQHRRAVSVQAAFVGFLMLGLSGSASSFAAQTGGDGLGAAEAALRDGRLVEAKRALLEIDREGLTDEQRKRVVETARTLERRLRRADPVDLSIQKALLAIDEDDLREADRQAQAALRSDRATPEQRRAASDILDESARMRMEFAPIAPEALDRAARAMESAAYAQAKAELDVVYRSGVRLNSAQLRSLDRMRGQIFELEQRRGAPFEQGQADLGVLPQRGAQLAVQAAAPALVLNQDAGQAADDSADIVQEALQIEAQRLLAEASAAFEARRLNEALEKYNVLASQYKASLTADESQLVDRRLSEVRALLDQPELLERTLQQREALRDEAAAEFDNFLATAEEALSAGDTDRALQIASEARIRLAQARDVFSDQEHGDLLARQQTLVQRIRDQEEAIRTAEAEAQAERLAEEAQQQQRRDLQERTAKINENLDRIRALQAEQKFDEALQIVDQVLFLDPQSAAGLLLKDVLQDVIIYQEWDRTQRTKQLSYARESVEMQKAMIATGNLLDYPSDWPEISVRRGEPQTFSESPADKRVLAELDNQRLPASFADNTVEDVIDFIATVTNLNVDVDWESLAEIGIDRDSLVTLNLQSLPARVVLERVLDKVSPDNFTRAGWAINDGILVVASEEALRRNTFIQIYDVRDLVFEIRDAGPPPQLDLNNVLNQAQSGGGGGSSPFRDDQTEQDLSDQEALLQIVEDLIRNSVDFEGWRENGGDTGSIQRYNGNLIITNTAKNHRQIAGILRQLREIRSIQVNVQANFLLVNQDFFEQIGFDVDLVLNANNTQVDDVDDQIRSFFLRDNPSGDINFRPSDLVAPFFTGDGSGSLTQIGITNPNTGAPPIIGTIATPFVVPTTSGLGIVPTQSNSAGLAETLFGGSTFASTILGANPALAVAGTFLDDIQVDFLIEATNADNRNVTLTAPRLTFTNGKGANIFFTTQTAFVSDLTPVVGTSSVAFDPTLSTVNSGVTLGLDGVVSADRRYVTMNVQTGIAQLEAFESRTFSATAGGVGGGGAGTGTAAVATGEIDFPIVRVTSLTTGVTIPDQGTLLLGGQRITSETEVETGVPVLSKIPILNRFFTNRIEEQTESTLMILLKPTILIQSEEEERNFPGLLDSLQNRLGTGF